MDAGSAGTLTREAALAVIESLPEEFSVDDFLKALARRQKLERGFADIAAGRVSSTADVRSAYGPEQMSIERGIEDMRAARFVTVGDLRKRYGLK